MSDEFEQHRRLLEHDQHQKRPGKPTEETEKPFHAPMYHSISSFRRGLIALFTYQ